MTCNPPVLVIGLGNTLLGDDALGRIAAERVRQQVDPRWVRVIDQVAPTPELAAEVAEASVVIFLDASVDGPEEHVVTRRLDTAEALPVSAHQLTAPAVVDLARQLYQHAPEAYAITSRARSLELADQCLSSSVERACDSLVAEALALVAQYAPDESQRREERSDA